MRLRLSGAALLAAISGGAGAHPHHDTDQQVMLSLGLARADIVLAVVPGTEDGPSFAAHLDADGNGAVSDAEADAFARLLLAGVDLSVDGQPVPLAASDLELPPLHSLAAGEAGLRLGLSGDLALKSPGDHAVMLTISSDGLTGDWFIQPYFHPDFAAAAQAIQILRPQPMNQLQLLFQTVEEDP